MKMTTKFYLQLVFFIVLFFGAIQPNYAIELGGVGVEKEVGKSAEGVGAVRAWEFLIDSPVIRKQISSLEDIAEVLDVRFFETAGLTEDAIRVGVNNSSSKAKLIKRIREASDEGSSKEQFLDAFSTNGKAIDHKMNTPVNQMDEVFDDLNPNATSIDVDATWNNRQNAVTKQQKVEASELLGEARVDQIYADKGWTRLDVDGIPPGKQGKFDRVYAEYDVDNNLVKLHVIEAKGGGGSLGSRVMSDGTVAQQGTKKYRDNIIENLLEKLPEDDLLREALEEVELFGEDLLSYVLIKQNTAVKSNYIVKTFP
jgi:hypothetical protein